jgi:hypothetical protein
MGIVAGRVAVALLLLGCAHVGRAQSVDDILNKSVAAAGGRAALMKLKSRSMTGTITLSTPAGDITGTVDVLSAVPNKSRTLIKADLSALGAGQLVVDQRFDGTAGYVLDTLQGNRDITGNQLDNLRNGSFPHPFLTYKEMGMSAQLSGKEKIGDRDVYVVVFEPTTGSVVRQYIDAETYLPAKSVVKIEVPQLGRSVEQTTELLDYHEVDGVKVPFLLKATSDVQNYTIVITKVEHNVPIDETLFSKPRTP